MRSSIFSYLQSLLDFWQKLKNLPTMTNTYMVLSGSIFWRNCLRRRLQQIKYIFDSSFRKPFQGIADYTESLSFAYIFKTWQSCPKIRGRTLLAPHCIITCSRNVQQCVFERTVHYYCS